MAETLWVLLIGVTVGFLNGVAGGAAVLSLPVMVAVGLNPVSAVMTNAIGVWSANVGALKGKYSAAKTIIKDERYSIHYSIIGACLGGLTLAFAPLKSFENAIPLLIAFSSLSLVFIKNEDLHPINNKIEKWMLSAVGFYAGYFGPGQGIMTIAILARDTNRSVLDINTRKNIIVALTCIGPNLIYTASGKVDWTFAFILGIGSLLGGYLGGKVVGKLNPKKYRTGIFVIGMLISIWFANKYWF